MIPRCPLCGSNETQHVGWDLKCLSCGGQVTETARLANDFQVSDTVNEPGTVVIPSDPTGINTTETFGTGADAPADTPAEAPA